MTTFIRGIGTIDPAETRRAIARTWGKKPGVKTPDAVVRAMHEHYEMTRSLQKTAEAFGRRSAGMVHRLFKRRGLPTRRRDGLNHRHPDALVASWYALYRELGSLRAVAARVGRTRTTISQVLKGHGWPVSRRNWQRSASRSIAA